MHLSCLSHVYICVSFCLFMFVSFGLCKLLVSLPVSARLYFCLSLNVQFRAFVVFLCLSVFLCQPKSISVCPKSVCMCFCRSLFVSLSVPVCEPFYLSMLVSVCVCVCLSLSISVRLCVLLNVSIVFFCILYYTVQDSTSV